MKPDDKVCLCFHVTRRKVVNFIRIEKPRRASQLSECFGAGTGCGWCRPYLERILIAETDKDSSETTDGQSDLQSLDQLTSDQYAQLRSKYVHEGGGTPPPGATPVE